VGGRNLAPPAREVPHRSLKIDLILRYVVDRTQLFARSRYFPATLILGLVERLKPMPKVLVGDAALSRLVPCVRALRADRGSPLLGGIQPALDLDAFLVAPLPELLIRGRIPFDARQDTGDLRLQLFGAPPQRLSAMRERVRAQIISIAIRSGFLFAMPVSKV
jgi:hypothetical protein